MKRNETIDRKNEEDKEEYVCGSTMIRRLRIEGGRERL